MERVAANWQVYRCADSLSNAGGSMRRAGFFWNARRDVAIGAVRLSIVLRDELP